MQREMIPVAYVRARLDHPEAEPALREEDQARLYAARDAVRAANGSAAAFTLPSQEMMEAAIATERRLDRHRVADRLRGGTTVTITSGGPSAKAYKFAAIGTSITLRRDRAGNYVLVNVGRIKVFPGQNAKQVIHASEAAIAAITRHALEGIVEHPPKRPRISPPAAVPDGPDVSMETSVTPAAAA